MSDRPPDSSPSGAPIETLVITDLDGSFWDKQLNCHPTTFPALAELRARKVGLLAATGRRAHSALGGMRRNDVLMPAVLLNGALGVDFVGDEQFHIHPFAADDASAVVAALGGAGLAPIFYLADGRVAGPSDVTTGPAHRATLVDDFVEADPAVLLTAGDADSRIVSFSMIGLPKAMVAPVTDLIPPDMATAVVYQDHLYDNAWSVHIQPAGISKWNGIEAYLDHAGLRPDRVIAIGDGSNDVEMLQHADLALGVSGGHSVALDVADAVIPHPTDGGWATILDYL